MVRFAAGDAPPYFGERSCGGVTGVMRELAVLSVWDHSPAWAVGKAAHGEASLCGPLRPWLRRRGRDSVPAGWGRCAGR